MGAKFVSSGVFLGALLILNPLSAFSADEVISVDTRIQAILAPESSGESYKALSTSDARVYEVAPSDGTIIRFLQANSEGVPLHLILSGDRIISAEAMTAAEAENYSDVLDGRGGALSSGGLGDLTDSKLDYFNSPTPGELDYLPSQLATVTETVALFDMLDTLNRHSQCYQRAHVWSYQLWNARSIKSMKVFLFFTQRFIRSHHYKWWFHVAPFVYAQGKEIVLDPQFTSSPLEMPSWTSVFVTTHAFCPEVAKYTDYQSNQMAEDCYTLKLPMYFYQPRDGEALEKDRVLIPGWRSADLSHAARARRSGWWPF